MRAGRFVSALLLDAGTVRRTLAFFTAAIASRVGKQLHSSNLLLPNQARAECGACVVSGHAGSEQSHYNAKRSVLLQLSAGVQGPLHSVGHRQLSLAS